MEQINKKKSADQNFGHSSRLPYDESAYQDKLKESVGPLLYKLNANSIHNCKACLSTVGPRSKYGASVPENTCINEIAPSQSPEIVNIESILTNRNIVSSKNKKYGVNPLNVSKLNTRNVRLCENYLDPISSKLSYPAANYRELGINRFYDLNKNHQNIIYMEDAIDTHLEAIDNYIVDLPELWDQNAGMPTAEPVPKKCKTIKICPVACNSIKRADLVRK
jgi:hypothetical protein